MFWTGEEPNPVVHQIVAMCPVMLGGPVSTPRHYDSYPTQSPFQQHRHLHYVLGMSNKYWGEGEYAEEEGEKSKQTSKEIIKDQNSDAEEDINYSSNTKVCNHYVYM